MKKVLLITTLFTSLFGLAQNLVEECSPINGNIQMTWYPMSQYTNPNTPGFVYTEDTTNGSPNIGLISFQIPMVVNYTSTVTISEYFEIAINHSNEYSQSVVQEMGSTRNIEVRMKYGLPAGDYTGTLTTTTSYFPNNVCTYTLYGRVLPATASVDDFNISGLKVFPNPVKDLVHFTKETDVTIFSALGAKVGEYYNVSSLNVSELAKGVYLINTPKFGQHKFIKQ